LKPGYGLSFGKFEKLLETLFGVKAHPFSKEIFAYFDRNGDGLIDFEEFVLGLDIIERGNLDEKSDYCFKMYDVYGTGALDIFTLREVLNRSYSRHFIGLERAI
jgi:Ca2+-binding EF-hand superfamily protein